MEALIIDQGKDTPQVIFNPKNNKYRMSGKSYPEDALAFYNPVFKWLEEFKKSPIPNAEFEFQLRYINSISTKMILDLFRHIADCIEKEDSIKIVWEYKTDNEDLAEQGEEFGDILDVPVELRETT